MDLLVVESVERDSVAFTNQFLCPLREIDFAIGENEFCLSFANENRCRQPALSFAVSGRQNGEICVSLADTKLFQGMIDWLNENHLEDLPEDFAAILLDSHLGDLLETVSTLVGDELEVTKVECNRPAVSTSSELPIVLTTNSGTTHGLLSFGEDWQQSIMEVTSQAAPAIANDLNALRIVEPIEVGTVTLPIKEFASLECGDVLLLEDSDLVEHGRVTVQCGQSAQLKLRTKSTEFAFDSVVLNNHSTVHCSKESALESVNQLDITVHVCCGRTEISVGQMSQLQVDDPIPTTGTNVRTVQLLACKQVVGSGELIQGNDVLGVRIREFKSNSLIS